MGSFLVGETFETFLLLEVVLGEETVQASNLKLSSLPCSLRLPQKA